MASVRLPLHRLLPAAVLCLTALLAMPPTALAGQGFGGMSGQKRPEPEAPSKRRETPDLAGVWRGSYAYADPGRPPVAFTLTLQDRQGALSGEIVEPNTFGDPNAAMLKARVRGRVDGNSVKFVKFYDGTGGVDHGVEYEGFVSPDGRQIDGQWYIGDTFGSFSLSRR
ncbi:MAG: hypothetical protein PHS60_05635 [Zavarzinia sp.]|nr:hypothetical protein [Zavarzinia sp.]